MITLETTVNEVDVNTLQTKLNARNSLQASVVYLTILTNLNVFIVIYIIEYLLYHMLSFHVDCKTIENKYQSKK